MLVGGKRKELVLGGEICVGRGRFVLYFREMGEIGGGHRSKICSRRRDFFWKKEFGGDSRRYLL